MFSTITHAILEKKPDDLKEIDVLNWNVDDLEIYGYDKLDAQYAERLMRVAVSFNKPEVLAFFLKNQINVNATSSTGNTALILATQNGNNRIVEMLLAANADPDIANIYGNTALIYATNKEKNEKHIKNVEMLLAAKANPNLGGQGGITALLAAVNMESIEIIEMLLAANADPNIANDSGTTPLIMALYSETDEIAKILLAANANPDIADKKGNTPLMLASHGKEEIVRILLSLGVDPNAVNANDKSALNYAEFIKDENKKSQIVNLLKEAGARKITYADHPVKIMQALGYAKIHANLGLCYGMAAVGMDYMKRGMEGIKELDDLLLALGDDDTNMVVKKINEMQRFRITYTKENRAKIKEEIERSLQDKLEKRRKQKKDLNMEDFEDFVLLDEEIADQSKEKLDFNDPALPTLLYKAFLKEMGEEKAKDTIDTLLNDLIKSKFYDTTEQDRKPLIEKMIRAKLRIELSSDNQEEINDAMLWKSIHKKMLEKLINILVQKKLDRRIRIALEKYYQKIDIALLDAPNYLQSIAISHFPATFKEYFEENIPMSLNAQNVSVSFPLVSSAAGEKQGLVTPPWGKFSGDFDKLELTNYFKQWRERLEAQDIKKPVTFMLTTSYHAVSLAYLPQEKKWAYNGYEGKKTAVIKDDEKLADLIHEDTSGCLIGRDRASIEGRVYSSKMDEIKVNKVMKSMYPDDSLIKANKRKRAMKAAALITLGLVSFAIGITILVLSGPLSAGLLFGLGGCLIGVVGYLRRGFGALFRTSEKQNEAVRANAERDAGYPGTSRYQIQRRLSNDKKMYLGDMDVNDEENVRLLTADHSSSTSSDEAHHILSEESNIKNDAIETTVNRQDPNLFTQKHLDFLHLQKDWKNMWKKKNANTDMDRILIKNFKHPSLFDSNRMLGFHQHYQKIQTVFEENKGKYNHHVYREKLELIDKELSALLDAPFLKRALLQQNIPAETYGKLKKLHLQVGLLLSKESAPKFKKIA